MINWFRTRLRNFLLENNTQKLASAGMPTVSESDPMGGEPIRFTITPARGGIVVSIRYYDRRNDRTNDSVHVIHDDQDVAANIGHIVSMELMKQ